MEYIPGPIHPKLQERAFLVLLNDFIFCLLKDRYDKTDLMDDSCIIPLPMSKGDIMSIRLFKPASSPYSTDLYCYVDSVFINGVEKHIKSESIIGKDFLERNQKNQALFREASIDELREIKINNIIS